MWCSEVRASAASLAIFLAIASCSKDAIAPNSPPTGPTSPQGPSATPPNIAPIGKAGADRLVECASHQGVTVVLDGSASSDRDGQIVLFEWFEEGKLLATGAAPTVVLGLGTHTILLRVKDNQGGTNDDVVAITIQDTVAPTVGMTIAPGSLWPPNHTMHLVSRAISVADACDAAPVLTVSVTSNEPENGLGDGDTTPDWLVLPVSSGTFDVWVRSERSGIGEGRVYTIRATAIDHSGNAEARNGTVTVPHNQ